MTGLLSNIVGKSVDPINWQYHSSMLSDLLIIVGLVTAAIWLVLCLICFVVERRAIRRFLNDLGLELLSSPTKVFSSRIAACTFRSDHRRKTV